MMVHAITLLNSKNLTQRTPYVCSSLKKAKEILLNNDSTQLSDYHYYNYAIIESYNLDEYCPICKEYWFKLKKVKTGLKYYKGKKPKAYENSVNFSIG